MNFSDSLERFDPQKFQKLEKQAFNKSPLTTNWGYKKSQLAWLQLVLEKMEELPYQDLESFSDSFDKVLEKVRERENQESNNFCKIEYKEIANSFYA